MTDNQDYKLSTTSLSHTSTLTNIYARARFTWLSSNFTDWLVWIVTEVQIVTDTYQAISLFQLHVLRRRKCKSYHELEHLQKSQKNVVLVQESMEVRDKETEGGGRGSVCGHWKLIHKTIGQEMHGWLLFHFLKKTAKHYKWFLPKLKLFHRSMADIMKENTQVHITHS